MATPGDGGAAGDPGVVLRVAAAAGGRGSIVQLPWWDEQSDQGFVVLGHPPASACARPTGN